jgi:hypothetical protein
LIIRRILPLISAFALFGMNNLSCKNTNVSEVSANTKLGSTSIDLTTYTGADYPVFRDFKKEIVLGNYYDIAAKIKKANIVPKGKMTPEEVVAIRFYTSNQYSKVNSSLRGTDAKTLGKYDSTIKAISSGLNKIPSKTCTVIRGSHLSEAILAEIEKKNAFTELAFMSTTKLKTLPEAFNKGNVTFKITSPRCRDISWLSELPKEEEVLFPPGSEFVVNGVTTEMKNGAPYRTITATHVSTRDLANEIAADKSSGKGKATLRVVTASVKLVLGTKKGQNYPPTAAERRPVTTVGLMGLTDEQEQNPEMELVDSTDEEFESVMFE